MDPDHAQHVLDNEHDYSAATIYRAAALSTLTPGELAELAHDRRRCAGRCERLMLPEELDSAGRCDHCRDQDVPGGQS